MAQILSIPAEPLGRFVLGEITIRQLGRLCGVDQDRVSRALRALGVDTSSGAHKRRRVACRTEHAADLPTGSAYEAAVKLYRQGAPLREVAAALGREKKAAAAFIRRLDEEVRPEWCREVFRYPDGRHMDLEPFARTLREMRLARGWSQRRCGEECRLCQQAISQLERTFHGPSWETLDKLVEGFGVSREDFGVTWEPLP
jgi:hypothetical protein